MKLVVTAIITLCCFALGLGGCHKEHEAKRTETVEVPGGVTNIIIPKNIWKKIEGDFSKLGAPKAEGEGGGEGHGGGEAKSEGGGEGHGGGHGEPSGHKKKLNVNKEELEEILKKTPPTKNIPIQVSLNEKTDGVLGKKNWLIKYPPGGGQLDLSKYISDSPKGSFYLKILWDLEELPIKSAKVYFVSRSKIRKIEGKDVGSGCEHFFDLTQFWSKTVVPEGLFLNTTSQRHISVLAGTYYFIIFKEGQVHQASLEVLDSRYRDLLCIAD